MGTPMNNPYGIPAQPFEPPAWQEYAICRQSDPERWFPEKGGSTKVIKKICNSCPVQYECLEYALDNGEAFGVWGGLSEQERRLLRRRTRHSVDVEARRAHVARLTAAGLDSEQIATELRMTARQVLRDRAALKKQAS